MKKTIALIAVVWLMLGMAWAHDAAAEELRPIGQATVNVRRGDLNGRQRPEVHSAIVAWYQNGEDISIYEIDGEWALTAGSEYGTCWVNINYLATEEAGSYTVNANGRLRVRETPGGNTVGWFKPGQTVEVLSIFGTWARTETGWVMSEYLERRND